MNAPATSPPPAASPLAGSPFAPVTRLAGSAHAPRRSGWRRLMIGGGVLSVVGLVGASLWAYHQARLNAARTGLVRELPLRPVNRVEFATELVTNGRVESHKNTVVTCQLERMSVSNEGRTISASGNAIVLDVVPEGARVQKGDVLCRLNSADYEELVRTQLMKTDQARAALEQARLSLGVAELAVEEYSKGLSQQSTLSMEGEIALAESDIERAADRLRWSQKMLLKGYVPKSTVSGAVQSLAMQKHKLLTSRWDLSNHRNFGEAHKLMELRSEVEKRRYEVTANEQRVGRLEERLAVYRKMVDYCTIRSPHDGLVIYATDPWSRDKPRLEPGVEVRQQQELFYLPNLDDMEVVAYVHESVARKVVEGQAVTTTIEGLGHRLVTGRVVTVSPLPVSSPVWTISQEVKYFIARIKLDEAPVGILPGMSAEVTIKLDRSSDVLAVPTEAVASEEGHSICYVAGADGLERRLVTLGRSNPDLLEVTRGLSEGEEVVINPSRIEALQDLVVQSAEPTRSPEAEPTEVAGEGSVGAAVGAPASVE